MNIEVELPDYPRKRRDRLLSVSAEAEGKTGVCPHWCTPADDNVGWLPGLKRLVSARETP